MSDQGNLSDILTGLAREFARQRKLVSATKGIQYRSAKVKAEMRAAVESYLREVRPGLAIITVETTELDKLTQDLFTLTRKDASVSSYKTLLTKIEKGLHKIQLDSELHLSDAAIEKTRQAVSSDTERKIIKTLQELIPSTALSYQQVLLDISDAKRVSYRGTATELREILRETLDHLAPDIEVQKSENFKFEKDRNKPTMRQKAHFILKFRGQAEKSIEVPGKSIQVVEESVSSLVRSTYDRGSIETHTQSGLSKPSLLQLKMYVDSVLCELLEIHMDK